MTDYNKLKVTELKELLTQRNLSTDGKKGDLVARLAADDDANAATEATEAAPTPAAPAPAVEKKEIKKVIPATTTATPPATSQPAAAPAGERKKFTFKRITDEFEEPKPVAEPEPVPAEVTAEPKVETTSPAANGSPVAIAAPSESFSAGLTASTVDSELEKRKLRAARFGVPVSDGVKIIERAHRFATGNDPSTGTEKSLNALDSALGENKSKKRHADTRIQKDHPKKNKETGGSGAPASHPKGVLTNPEEKVKADLRARRFGNA